MGAVDAGERAATTIDRVAAAERVAGDRLVVCPVGWSTEVHELSGAIAVVWNALDGPRTVAELASACGVEPDDELLRSSIATLCERGLGRVTPRS